MNEVEQETIQDSSEESSIDSVNINSIHLNKNCSVITANLKTSADKHSVIVPYKVDMDSAGNIMPLHIHKKMFPRITNEQLAATKNESIQIKMYNKTTITQFGTCTVKIQNNNKHKLCTFFVLQGKGQYFLGMHDIDVLDIININIYSICTEHHGGNDNFFTNKATSQSKDTM